MKGANPIDQLESIDGEAVIAHELELTEINIRGFVLSELDKMYAEFLICARPTLVDDETGNSLQVLYYTVLYSSDLIYYYIILAHIE